jgi:hypothetical protein
VLINQLEGVKFLLFLYCYSLRSRSSQVEVLWEDHRNDLFINSFGEIPRLCHSGLYIDVCIQASSCQLEAANWLGVCFHFRLLAFSDPRDLDLDPIGAIVVSDVSHKPPRS